MNTFGKINQMTITANNTTCNWIDNAYTKTLTLIMLI